MLLFPKTNLLIINLGATPKANICTICNQFAHLDLPPTVIISSLIRQYWRRKIMILCKKLWENPQRKSNYDFHTDTNSRDLNLFTSNCTNWILLIKEKTNDLHVYNWNKGNKWQKDSVLKIGYKMRIIFVNHFVIILDI